MTTVNLDLIEFVKAVSRTLGWVVLKPQDNTGDELTPPDYAELPPYVMDNYIFVPSDNYLFEYQSVRYAKLSYLLERDGSYEAGELTVLHNLPLVSQVTSDEIVMLGEQPVFIPPGITMMQSATIGAIGSLGVLFNFMHDFNSTIPKFGLGFKIVDANPSNYPKLIAAYSIAFDMGT